MGDTLLGRSGACHVTIEDPLVSRQHARIRVTGARATIKDLASRNGTYVNETPIDGECMIEDGDRVRVGTMELVFCAVTEAADHSQSTRRVTGAMLRCLQCGNAYAEGLSECPVCGITSPNEEVTISAVIGSAEGWSMELVVSVLDKALSLERWDDVERVMRRARPTVERLVAGGEYLDRGQLEFVALAAARLACHQALPDWAVWLLTIYATLSLVPGPAAVTYLEQLAAELPGQLAEAAARLVSNVQANGGPGRDERDTFARLEVLAGVAC